MEQARDERTRRQKLEAMASQTVASPREAEIARRLLDALPAPRTLSRDEILSAPDERLSVRSRTIWHPYLRAHVIVDLDDPIFADLFTFDVAEGLD